MRLGLVNLLVVNLSLLGPTHKASVNSLLSALVRLSSHGSLIRGELIAADDEAVDRDHHTILEVENVTNVQMVHMEVKHLRLRLIVESRDLHLIISNKVLVSEIINFISQNCNASDRFLRIN